MPDMNEVTLVDVGVAALIAIAILAGFALGYEHLGPLFNTVL